jgi:hypothetical protein
MAENRIINRGKYTLDIKLLLSKIELLTDWKLFANKFQNNIPEYMTI